MKRIFAILLTIFLCATASAQIENSIVLDRSTFRAVQSDALTGVNIDPIGVDRSRRACARLKIFFHRMTREQMEQLEPVFPSGTIDYTKCKVAEGNTVLILEFTARPQVKFYLKHPTFGTSNEVEFDFEGDKEYQLEASLNQTYSIVVNSNVTNADVYLDGVFKGKTDSSNSLTIKEVMIGGHKLKVQYGKVSSEQDIEVNDGSISFRQSVNTAANEPQFVVFTVEPQSAVVTIDGKHYTLTEGAMRAVLDGGTYNYTVSA
ncbi:MAG: PEGA domain-containing protein, partial [Alistipes sp.]|nr:PEGA domain-containing protein [Alistipes sp.]